MAVAVDQHPSVRDVRLRKGLRYRIHGAGRHTRTLPIAVFNMIGFEEINWGPLAAAATMITLPVIVLTLIVQRHIVSGLTFGAVKR